VFGPRNPSSHSGGCCIQSLFDPPFPFRLQFSPASLSLGSVSPPSSPRAACRQARPSSNLPDTGAHARRRRVHRHAAQCFRLPDAQRRPVGRGHLGDCRGRQPGEQRGPGPPRIPSHQTRQLSTSYPKWASPGRFQTVDMYGNGSLTLPFLSSTRIS
jgi:hypothetical protein